MQTLFVGLSVPEVVADALSQLQSGVDGARWRPVENFHLTLAYLGEADRHDHDRAIEALSSIEAPGFELTLSGAGFFGDQRPRALWAGTETNAALDHLQQKVETALRNNDFDLERRKFTPHVTLAYLSGALQEDCARYCAGHGLFSCGPFPVEAFHLYSSNPGAHNNLYEIEASYALSARR